MDFDVMDFDVYDFFCGCGGGSEGLRQAGMSIQLGVDNAPKPLAVFSLNNPNAASWLTAVDQVNPFDVLDMIGRRAEANPNVRSVFIACPPCQPFSKMIQMTEKYKATRDERRDAATSFVDLVEHVGPDAILMENVPAFVGSDAFVDCVRRLEAMDYGVVWRVYNLAVFGVPQYRWRVVLVAVRHLTFFQIELPCEHWHDATLRTVRDAIGDLPHPAEEHGLEWHIEAGLSPLNMARIQSLQEGQDHRQLPPLLRPKRQYANCYGRLAWDKPASTLTTGCTQYSCGPYGHPKQHRSITVLEAALLQSFPLEYRFVGKRTNIAKMIGNAFPPLAAKAFGGVIRDALSNRKDT